MEIDPGDRMITDQEEVIMDYEEEVEMSAGTAEEDAMMDDEVGTGEGENDHDMDAEPTTTTAIPPEVIIDATVPIPSFFPSTAVPAITTTPPLANVGGLSSQPFPSPPAPETEMTPVNEEPPVGVSMTESKPDGLATPLTVEEGVGASSNPTAIPTIPPPAANSSALPTVSSSPALLPPVQQESLQVKAESSTMGGASDPSIDLNSGVSTDPSSSTATASSSLHGRPASDEDRAPASTNDENEEEEAEKVVEENDDQEEYFEDDEKTIDAHTLPPICLHLPGLGARALFSPLPKDEVDMNLPVWLKDRQEDLAGATLAEVWSAIREELRREKMDKSGEMVLVEKQMELRMGDDDKHLQTVTLLDFLQVHHDCALPLPVQLYLVFEPNRFIARFHAIKKEVEDRRESTASEEEPEYIYEDGETQADQTGNDEEGDEQEREEQADDEGEYDGDYPEEDDYAEGEAEAEAEVEVQPEEVSAEDEVQEEEQDQEEQEEVQAEEEEEEETEEEADPEPQEQLESEPRAAVDYRARYGGSDLAHERRQVDWARAHGDSGPAMPRSSRIILQRSRSSSTEDEPKAKRVRSKTEEEPPQESEDETPVDRENNGDESGEAEDDGHRETISGTSSRETHSNHDNNHNMSEAQNGDGIMGSETYGNSEAIDIQAAVKPNQRDPVLADSEVEVDEGYGSDDEEGDGADPAVNEESGVVDTDEVEVEKDEGFEDDVLNEDAGGGSYDAVIDALDDNHRNPVPLDEKALWDTAKEDPESASNTIILPSGTASPAFQDVSPTATDTNLLSTHNASPLSPGPTTGPFETITEESEDPDDYLLNNRPDYYVDPYGADTVSPVPSTDKELTGTGDATGSYEKFADSPSTATTVPGESDDDDSLEAVWPRPEDMNNDSFDEIPDTLEVTGDGTNDVDYDVGERSSTTSSPPPTSVTDESRRS